LVLIIKLEFIELFIYSVLFGKVVYFGYIVFVDLLFDDFIWL